MLSNSLNVCQPFKILLLRILFKSVSHFFIELFVLLMSSFLSSLYILEISLLSDVGLVKIFSYSVGCHFVLLTVPFRPYRSFSVSGGPIYSLLLLMSVLLGLYIESGLLCSCVAVYFPLSLLSGSV